jgi:hypothetical protein
VDEPLGWSIDDLKAMSILDELVFGVCGATLRIDDFDAGEIRVAGGDGHVTAVSRPGVEDLVTAAARDIDVPAETLGDPGTTDSERVTTS